jgi:hypothetical protein
MPSFTGLFFSIDIITILGKDGTWCRSLGNARPGPTGKAGAASRGAPGVINDAPTA